MHLGRSGLARERIQVAKTLVVGRNPWHVTGPQTVQAGPNLLPSCEFPNVRRLESSTDRERTTAELFTPPWTRLGTLGSLFKHPFVKNDLQRIPRSLE